MKKFNLKYKALLFTHISLPYSVFNNNTYNKSKFMG